MQHGQIFHPKEAHPEKLHTMNFRCNVTMTTIPNQNNNKDSFQPNGKNFFNNAIQITSKYNRMIANIICYQQKKRNPSRRNYTCLERQWKDNNRPTNGKEI